MEGTVISSASSRDTLAEKLRTISHWILTGVFGLLPLIFVPLGPAGLEYTKVLVVVGALAFALIFYALSVLRSGTVSLHVPLPFYALLAILATAGASVVLSGDMSDAFMGNVFGIHTAAFVLLLVLTVFTTMIVGFKKEWIMRLYMLFVGSTFVLALFHVARLVFGPEFLSLGIFTSSVSTPVGGWNDLALFLGLTVLLALVTFEQIPLTKWGKILFGFVVTAALALLAVINFFFVFVVLGTVSLVMVVYSLGRDRFQEQQPIAKHDRSIASLVLPVGVFVVSALFVLGGPILGGSISKLTNISYVEVRPSFEATADIARGVYGDNFTKAFLGVGTNRFEDAWRTYKDESLNETVFWNTDFQSGNGYIGTFFVTTGILGGLAWLAFLGLFVFGGVRTLLRAADTDKIWYFIGTSSFVGATFIWGMSLVYVPGATMLILAAFCTGIFFVAQANLNPSKVRFLKLAINRRTGFILTLGVIAVIIVSVGGLYGTVKHYTAAYTFAESVFSARPGVDVEAVEAKVASAFEMSPNDFYARRVAEYQLARMDTLLGIQEPSELQQQQFQAAIANGVNAGNEATRLDGTDPENWAVLGRIYSVLAAAGIDQSYELAKQSLEKAREFDPKNPLRVLELAVLESRNGNIAEATRLTEEAIGLKSNYSDALFFLSQLNIAAGDVEKAVAATRAMIQLEPQNPSRYYQLGVLEASRENLDIAISAFQTAVSLDSNYANARYFLALAYSEKGMPAEAKAELQKVLELNPGNELVTSLIGQLDAKGKIELAPATTTAASQPVTDQNTVTETNDDVTTTENPDTPLITPVNTPAAEPEPAGDAATPTE